MKTLVSVLAICAIALFCSPQSFAQKDYSALLKKEIVKIENGKFVSAEYMLLKFGNGETAQVKVSASCPVDVMSRDNFISLYSNISVLLLLATFNETEQGMPDILDLDELIGDPDLTYHFVMAKNGIQIQVASGEEKENVTLTWDQLFAE